MSRQTIANQIVSSRLIAIIRLKNSKDVYPVCSAIAEGGITCIEITLTTPNALGEIEKLSQHSNILIGVGSVVNKEQAHSAIKSGAQYVVSPVTKQEIIRESHRLEKPVISGAFTPTEMRQAFDWHADFIKLFPAAFLGSSYLKAVKAPMPELKIIPTGGINKDNAKEWLKSGAEALGIGGALLKKEWVENKDYKSITKNTHSLLNSIT